MPLPTIALTGQPQHARPFLKYGTMARAVFPCRQQIILIPCRPTRNRPQTNTPGCRPCRRRRDTIWTTLEMGPTLNPRERPTAGFGRHIPVPPRLVPSPHPAHAEEVGQVQSRPPARRVLLRRSPAARLRWQKWERGNGDRVPKASHIVLANGRCVNTREERIGMVDGKRSSRACGGVRLGLWDWHGMRREGWAGVLRAW